MSSNSNGIPAGRLAQYAMLVASVPGLERRGSKAPYTSLNGNKSSFLTDTGSLALRLDADGRYDFMRRNQAQLCERHGRVMKEYVAVPEQMWKERTALRRAFVSSVAYVGSLKPKVPKRKSTAVLKTTKPVPETVTSPTMVSRKPAAKAPLKASAKSSAKSAKTSDSTRKTTRKTATRKATPKKAVARRKATAR